MSPNGVENGSVHPSNLPDQYQPAGSEPSVFESEPERKEGVVREEDTDWAAGMPKEGSAKKRLAMFQKIQQQSQTNGDSTPSRKVSPACDI